MQDITKLWQTWNLSIRKIDGHAQHDRLFKVCHRTCSRNMCGGQSAYRLTGRDVWLHMTFVVLSSIILVRCPFQHIASFHQQFMSTHHRLGWSTQLALSNERRSNTSRWKSTNNFQISNGRGILSLWWRSDTRVVVGKWHQSSKEGGGH